MKKQLTLPTLMLAVLLLSACSNNNNTVQESKPIDSIKLKDSLTKAEIKRVDEKKVIGDIEFGISKREFDKKSEAFTKPLKMEKSEYIYLLGNYEFSSLEGSFDNSQLYEAVLRGWVINYEEYDSNLIPQVETLKTMLVGKYGEPSKGDGAPAWHQTQNDYSYLAYSWIVGSKTVEVRVSDRGLYYTADLKIYQPAIEDAIVQRAAKKDLEIANAAKEVL